MHILNTGSTRGRSFAVVNLSVIYFYLQISHFTYRKRKRFSFVVPRHTFYRKSRYYVTSYMIHRSMSYTIRIALIKKE